MTRRDVTALAALRRQPRQCSPGCLTGSIPVANLIRLFCRRYTSVKKASGRLDDSAHGLRENRIASGPRYQRRHFDQDSVSR
jgi:hypothetical protein